MKISTRDMVVKINIRTLIFCIKISGKFLTLFELIIATNIYYKQNYNKSTIFFEFFDNALVKFA